MKRHLSFLIGIMLFSPALLLSQENRVFTIKGYVSSLQSAFFDSVSGPFVNENILHNRLNISIYPTENLTLELDVRNRLFTGDRVRMEDYFSDFIGRDPGMADLSWNLLNEQSFLFNTTIDRLWMDLRLGKFQVTAGRQRINWGQTFVWNPNDIFNSYSFFDFDYVERPGSDAIRLQYFPDASSAAEMAVKVNEKGEVTAAGLYRFNRWGYDLQVLAGMADGRDLVAGAGWSGQLGSLAFRGEGSWFEPIRRIGDDKGTLLLTAGLDKLFENNSMAQVQLMYCNRPFDVKEFTSLYFNQLSARDLAYSRFSAFGQFTWSVNPLLNLGLSAMWFPDLNGWFAGPSLDFSLAENLGFSLIGQHFNVGVNDFETKLNLAFLRVKYSF